MGSQCVVESRTQNPDFWPRLFLCILIPRASLCCEPGNWFSVHIYQVLALALRLLRSLHSASVTKGGQSLRGPHSSCESGILWNGVFCPPVWHSGGHCWGFLPPTRLKLRHTGSIVASAAGYADHSEDDLGVCFTYFGAHRIPPMVSPLVHLAQTCEDGSCWVGFEEGKPQGQYQGLLPSVST